VGPSPRRSMSTALQTLSPFGVTVLIYYSGATSLTVLTLHALHSDGLGLRFSWMFPIDVEVVGSTLQELRLMKPFQTGQQNQRLPDWSTLIRNRQGRGLPRFQALT